MARIPIDGPKPGGPYSPAVAAEGRLVFVSGQLPARDGQLVSGSIEEETQAVLDNIGSILRNAGCSPADVVRCGVFLAEPDDFDAMNAVYERFFPEPRPARTTVVTRFSKPIKVEIDCVAVLP